ncbi:MAG TPA: putative toxin-antitoxin system toxin component, PIN family [Elusimicrobia bacterium]|jgi:hypothetical protein|nr:putative toxin-antitoxin system toxin component, PIN family [Elusimicrobiota bacterium]
MTIVLLDTNVWISAFLNPYGYPAKLILLWLDEKFQVVLSPQILNEIRSVLHRPRIKNKYKIQNYEIDRFIYLLIQHGLIVFPSGKFKLCRDRRDNHLLEAVLLSKAKYLVTRDDDIKRDINLIAEMKKQNVNVTSVSKFLKKFSKER